MKQGYLSDDGEEIDPASVPTPLLCISCLKNNDANEEVICMLNRMDQMKEVQNGEMFCCFVYEPIDPHINKQQIFDEMERYLAKKNSEWQNMPNKSVNTDD
jgi:hypothetical protein